MLFFCSALYYLSLPLFFLSLCCYELTFPCAEGVVIPKSERELLGKTSPITNVSLAMLLPNFYNWSFWSYEWKMTILKALTDSKQVGESYSQAIKNLVQIPKASAGAQSVFLLLWTKSLIQNQHPEENTWDFIFCIYLIWNSLIVSKVSQKSSPLQPTATSHHITTDLTTTDYWWT